MRDLAPSQTTRSLLAILLALLALATIGCVPGAELGYQRDDRDEYAIKSDFPLSQTTSDWHRSPGHLFQEHQRVSGSASTA